MKWILLVSSIALLNIGCAGFGKKLKSFMRGEKSPSSTSRSSRKAGTTFSQNPNFTQGPRRKYKRMTRAKLADESHLAASSGSLWVMEGQGAYLFSQNIMRMIGDPLSVKIEGEPREQLESKVKIISELTRRLEEKRAKAARRLAQQKSDKGGKDKKAKAKGTDNKDKSGDKAGAANNDSDFPVKRVPTRIVERLVDGNYRIKGSQPFMIGKREYSVIVTGIVRAADFSDDGISATQLLDPKFDIIGKRRKEARL